MVAVPSSQVGPGDDLRVEELLVGACAEDVLLRHGAGESRPARGQAEGGKGVGVGMTLLLLL